MNKEDTVTTLVAAGLIMLGLSTIIVSEAIYIKSLETRIQKMNGSMRGYKRYYRDALDRLDSSQLIQHALQVGEELKFDSIVKDF